MSAQAGGITASELKEILAANNAQQLELMKVMVTEFRKPQDPPEDEKLRIEQEKKMRQQTGEQELAIQANRRAEQRRCNHRHPNGQSCVTNVDNLGCVICVHCQGMIKPAEGPYDEPGRYIYDENLYWSLRNSQQQTTF